jgi:prolyl oligopeptidase
MLYGYGGFNISSPSFSISNAVWMENGVFLPCLIYEVVANTEKDGMMRNQNAKQNVFDDFIAAAEYLMRKIYFL